MRNLRPVMPIGRTAPGPHSASMSWGWPSLCRFESGQLCLHAVNGLRSGTGRAQHAHLIPVELCGLRPLLALFADMGQPIECHRACFGAEGSVFYDVEQAPILHLGL